MTFETKAFVIRNPTIILWLVITAAMTTIGIILWINLRSDNLLLATMLSIPLTMAFPLILSYILTSKVKFDEETVIKYSLFIKTEIRTDKIKSYGVVGSGKSGFWLVDPDNINENEFGQTYFIFLSEADKFDLDSMNRQNNLRLQFRKDIYEKIKVWLKKSQRPTQFISNGRLGLR
jgi:hypothetical protein